MQAAMILDELGVAKGVREVICVVGATATGKSTLAQEIAEVIDGKILSADSMQVYRGMDIGTAKVPESERTVEYFGIDLVEPSETYSVQQYQDYARDIIKRIFDAGSTPVIVGGTGFYIRAAIDDYQFAPGDQLDNPIRKRYERFLEDNGIQALYAELERLDPESAKIIHPNNTVRVIRALEMHFAGESYADRANSLESIKQVVPAKFIGLQCDRDVLYERINKRVDTMFDLGLVEEVESLIASGFKESLTSKQAIGYKEIISALDGDISMQDAKDMIKRATRRYAKRQGTWFRKDSRINWINV